MWKPCLPGGRPWRSTATFTLLSPACVNVTVPVVLPNEGCVVAALAAVTLATAVFSPAACIIFASEFFEEWSELLLQPMIRPAVRAGTASRTSFFMTCLREGCVTVPIDDFPVRVIERVAQKMQRAEATAAVLWRGGCSLSRREGTP